jgi:hypothetical protein
MSGFPPQFSFLAPSTMDTTLSLAPPPFPPSLRPSLPPSLPPSVPPSLPPFLTRQDLDHGGSTFILIDPRVRAIGDCEEGHRDL